MRRLFFAPLSLALAGFVIAACSGTDSDDSSFTPGTDASADDPSTAPDAAKDAANDGAPGTPPPTLDDFWEKKAYFVQTSVFQNGSDGNVGFSGYNANQSVGVKDGTWYVFGREFVSPQPSYCPADSTRTIVKSSTDHGMTWSKDTTIVDQVPNTATECNALDGDVFYDAPSNTWLHLDACIHSNSLPL